MKFFIAIVIILLLFARRLPGLGEGIGKAITNFKRAYKGEDSQTPPKK